MKISIICVLLFVGLSLGQSRGDAPYSYQPKEGLVPDAKTAFAIAEAVWLPIYGKKQIDTERPFHATLKKGVWTVEGQNNLPAGDFGGSAIIEISKKDGRILRVSHGM